MFDNHKLFLQVSLSVIFNYISIYYIYITVFRENIMRYKLKNDNYKVT